MMRWRCSGRPLAREVQQCQCGALQLRSAFSKEMEALGGRHRVCPRLSLSWPLMEAEYAVVEEALQRELPVVQEDVTAALSRMDGKNTPMRGKKAPVKRPSFPGAENALEKQRLVLQGVKRPQILAF